MGPMTLFIHLEIILLQCFQFQFSVSAKISYIQTKPIYIYIYIYMLSYIGSQPNLLDMVVTKQGKENFT